MDLDESEEGVSHIEALDEDSSDGEGPGPDDEVTEEDTESGELDEADDEDDESDPDDDEDADEDEPEDEDESDEEADEPEGEEAEADPTKAKLEALVKQQADQLARYERHLKAIAAQQQPGGAVPQGERVQYDPRITAAVSLLLVGGGTKEDFERFPREIQDAAQEFVRFDNRRTVAHAMDDRAFYVDRLQKQVRDEIQQAVAPLIARQSERWAAEQVAHYQSVLKSSEDKLAVRKLMTEMYGAESPVPVHDQLRNAVRLYEAERNKGTLSKAKRRLNSKAKQEAANKKSRRGVRAGKGKRRGKREAPDLGDYESLGEYANRIKDMDLEDLDAEGVDFD